ncbi:beta-glucosidase [Malassezia brasiliensis]|uniref:Beta-glucosidase n=1 Tax=Malassezia brasiliensis TaxID=1821822 RepID=A0AAF0IN34_9BASI|nr:beta-glucosidase [Malassezia brasiliensis]
MSGNGAPPVSSAPLPPLLNAVAPSGMPACVPSEPRKAAKVSTVVNTRYFTPGQFDKLLAKARANKMPLAKWEQHRMTACAFISAVGAKLGIPQRTIASAQLLYQRFHLFYPPADFAVHQVALASLFTASKLNDTQKRIHDLLMASYLLRNIEQLAPPSGAQTSGVDWIAHAHVADADLDLGAMAQERVRLLTLERMMLQCICFQFEMRAQKVLRLVVKMARRWDLPKLLGALAWRVACDAHRTPAPLLYPPQTVAVGSVYAAVVLAEENGATVAAHTHFAQPEAWPAELRAHVDDAKEVVVHVLTSYAQHLPSLERGNGAVPLYVVHPPPLGLQTWRAVRQAQQLPVGASELEQALTHAKIRVRQDEQARNEPEAVRRRRAVARANDALPATLYRADPLEQQMVATRYLLE